MLTTGNSSGVCDCRVISCGRLRSLIYISNEYTCILLYILICIESYRVNTVFSDVVHFRST